MEYIIITGVNNYQRGHTGWAQIGMKMEWKLSVFSEEKWKRRGNMKMEMEISKTEVEMDFFMRKRKQKRNGVF